MYFPCLQGGRAGDAYGITVSSLNKLKDTKSKIPRLSLLHYISQVTILLWAWYICLEVHQYRKLALTFVVELPSIWLFVDPPPIIK